MPQLSVKIVRADLGEGAKVKSPFVSVTFKGQTKKTQSKSGSSPVWNETITFELAQHPAASDEIKLEIFDDDGFLGIDKRFGKATVSYNGLKLSKEKSLDIKAKKGASIPGARIVVSSGDSAGKVETGKTSGKAQRKASEKTKKDESETQESDEGIGDIEGGAGYEASDGRNVVPRTDRSTLSDKPEDFQVRVKVLSARQLSGSNIKPVVKVKAGRAQAKSTRIRKGASPTWDELMMFNFTESLRDLYDFVFEFSVNNSKLLRSDSLIGSFKLDLGSVYDQPGHAYVRKWLLLTQSSDASNTPKGYLKITICMLGAGDQPPDDTGNENDDDVEGNLLTPAGATLRSSNFTLRVYKAEDLPQMDTSAFKSMKKIIGLGEEGDSSKKLVDSYIQFSFAGKEEKTSVIEGRNDPEWNEELNLPIKFPSMCDAVKITISDWDRMTSDDPIGTVIIPMSRISSTGEDSTGAGFLPTFGPTFVNFYGSPREFSTISDSLAPLNIGKGDGCAYRGRAMIELTTTLEEEGSEPVPPKQIIGEDQLISLQKRLRRRCYRLVVGFVSANLIDKNYDNLQFEVSIGNYGNKFDADAGTACSVTEPTNPAFDGCRYYFLPWASKKPVVMVTSQWEDVNFRLHGVNFILRLCERMNEEVQRVKQFIAISENEVEIASEIVGLLDTLIQETSKPIPGPRGRPVANQLDKRVYQQRIKTFKSVADEANNLRQNCTDADEAIAAIVILIERLENIAFEPQNSIPDVIIWMISDNKRIAYFRIPAYDILHCHEKPEYSGRFCSKPQNICLKIPTWKSSSKKHYKIPCQIRIIAWLGLAKEQNDFDFHSRGQTSVYADTYEMESKVPIRGWVSDGFKDITGEIPLPKDSFVCPRGWEWDGDWEISSEINLLRDAGHSSYLEEFFEYEKRQAEHDWEKDKAINNSGETIEGEESIKCPKGWEWEDEWSVDTRRACDEDGWEYSSPNEGQGEVAWSSREKSFHVNRRRRKVRNRTNVDPKQMKKEDKLEQMQSEGWEYAVTSSSQFHPGPRMVDLTRRRKWVRRMVTSETERACAIFNLKSAVSQSKETVPATSPTDKVSLSKGRSLLGSLGGGEEEEGKEIENKIKGKETPAPKIYMIHNISSKLQLRAYIYQGRDLIAMDQDSFSDPVVFVSFLNHCRRTAVAHHTLNPVWNQTLMMDITFYGDLRLLQKHCNDVVLEIFDKDDVGDIEFMGRTHGSPVLKFYGEGDQETRLKWLDVTMEDRHGGSILAAFELYLKHEQQEMPLPPPCRKGLHMVPYGIRPVLVRTALDFLIWGVRNMQPYQLLAVDTPSVLIQIGDVEIKTEMIKSLKKNPNLPQPLFFITANLPVDPLYFPPIVIRVKDHRKFGRRPTVGQHVITDVMKYRIKPRQIEAEQPDEGFDDQRLSPTMSLNDPNEVEIEVENPIAKQKTSKGFFGKLKTVLQKKSDDESAVRKDEIDWWSKYYASIGDGEGSGDYTSLGLDLIKIYKNELETQEDFNHFYDFIETFKLSRGKLDDDDDEPEFAGEFKGAFKIYELPEDRNEPLPPKCFAEPLLTDPVDIKIRVYVARAFELAPQDSNGLADPYLKIKVGKKRIIDRDNRIPNTLEPTFGRMFEIDVKIPMEKDLFVQVYDWDLIGTDDKIGETVIDLENRYLTKYRAWCGLPETYNTSGPTPWRDQMTPKDMLYDKARREGWDEPVWNGNTCVLLNRKTYRLNDFEVNKKPSTFWGEADQRLSLYILRTFPHVSEHVETRPLFSKVLPGIEQGRLHMWVDLFPKDHGDPGEPYNISPRQPSRHFVRVIIWNCSDIPMMDTSILGEKMTDIYFKGWVNGMEHKQEKTDVHYRSLDGTGMFNWRFVFPFDYLPQERLHYVSKKEHLWSLDKTVTKFPPVLTLQAWDNDIFKPNEYISEISLPLDKMPKCSKFRRTCSLDNIPDLQGNCKMETISMFDQKLLKGWWPLYKMEEGERKLAGKLEMSLEIVTEEEHDERPAGQGRDEPNLNPTLDKPKRPATSFAWFSSPFKSLRYIIWRRYKWIILGLLLLIIVVAFIVLFVYSFPRVLANKI